MKVIKTANGKKTIKMSKSEWETIGKKAGWTREATNTCPTCGVTDDPNSNFTNFHTCEHCGLKMCSECDDAIIHENPRGETLCDGCWDSFVPPDEFEDHKTSDRFTSDRKPLI